MNEIENVARILRDEVPLATSFWCRLGIHKWTMWSDPTREGSYRRHQTRKCAACNLYTEHEHIRQ